MATENRTETVRRSGWLARILIGLLVAVVAAGAALWIARLAIAQQILVAAIADRTGVEAELRVEALGLDRAVLTDLRLGRDGTLSAARVEVDYAPAELRDGRVRQAAVHGLRVRATVGTDGVSFGELDPLLAQPGDGGPPVALPPITVRDARADLATPFGPVAVGADAEIGPVETGGLSVEARLALEAAQGRMPGELDLTYAPDGAVTGRLVIAPTDLAFGPELVLRGLAGELDFRRPRGGRLPQVAARLSAAGGSFYGVGLGPITGTAGIEAEDVRAAFRLASADGGAVADVDLDLSPLAEPMRLALDGTVEISPDAALWQADVIPPTLRIEGPIRAEIAFDLAGAPDAVTGTLSVEAETGSAAFGPASAKAASLALRGRLDGTGDRLALHLEASSGLRLAGFSADTGAEDGLTAKDDLTVALRQGEPPALQVQLTDTGVEVVHDVHLEPASMEALLRTDGQRLRMLGRLPQARLAGRLAAGKYAGSAELDAGEIELPAWQLRVAGIGGKLPLPAPEGAPLAEVQVARIAHLAKPAAVVPLGLTGKIVRENQALAFRATVADPSGRLAATVTGRHDPETGAGQADARLRRLVFGVGIAGPETLFPMLRGVVDQASGEFALVGTASWGDGPAAAQAELLVENLTAKFGGISLRQANGVLEVDTRRRKAGPRAHQIAIAALELGVPLTDGLVVLRIDPEGRLLVDSMTWRVAGGRVFAKDFVADPNADRQEIVLEVADVDFTELIGLVGLEGLSVTGVLDGQVPVTIVGKDVMIKDGRLAVRQPGRLSYAPAAYPGALTAGGEGMALALKALENFQYDTLSLTLNRELGGETVATLSIKGRNPDLYEGYPIALNLNVSGKLDQILRQGLEGYQVPDQIRKRIENFAR